jgi:hypothetical protein
VDLRLLLLRLLLLLLLLCQVLLLDVQRNFLLQF